jgi:lipopolysaccharide export system permease protein
MGYKVAGTLLPEGRFLTFGKNTVYVGRNDGHELSDILVFSQPDATNGFESVIKAPRGVLGVSNQQVTLRLFDARSVNRMEDGNWSPSTWGSLTVLLRSLSDNSSDKKPQLTDMTFGQLQAELRRLESRFSQPNSGEMEPDEMRKWAQELQDEKLDVTMPLRVQIHRQVASAFACFGFTLVGIPLGIRAHRRETNAGVAMALGLVFIYYSFVIVGQALQTHAEWAPHLIVWLPNFIFQSAGAVMLWRANRGI